MKGALRIARLFGIDIAVHWTFLLLIGWIVFESRGAGLAATLLGVTFVLAVFVCVVLHELGHALTARAYGVQTRHISILPIGGVAALERIPTQPVQELFIAIAGPAVNLAIAAALLAVKLVFGDILTASSVSTLPGAGLLAQLAVMNIALAVFNLLPAFPMDGGRILRALLAIKLEYARATRIAAMCGRVMALGFAASALLGGGAVLFVIAVFVFFGGQAEAIAAARRSVVTGRRVADAMVTDLRVLPIDATVGQAAELLLAGAQQDFPVVDAEGRLVGLLRRDGLLRAVGLSGGRTDPIAPAVDRGLPVLAAGSDLGAAVETLRAHGPCLAVETEGRVVGLLTVGSVAEFYSLHRPDRRPRGWRGEQLGSGADPG